MKIWCYQFIMFMIKKLKNKIIKINIVFKFLIF
jgi:hypothetical protein